MTYGIKKVFSVYLPIKNVLTGKQTDKHNLCDYKCHTFLQIFYSANKGVPLYFYPYPWVNPWYISANLGQAWFLIYLKTTVLWDSGENPTCFLNP